MKKLTTISLAATSLLIASPIFADSSIGGLSPVTPTGNLDVVSVLTTVIDWVLAFSGAVAVLFLILGGLQYITAAGNEKRVETAKNTILYAVIGLVVILLSFVIVAFISQNIGKVVQ